MKYLIFFLFMLVAGAVKAQVPIDLQQKTADVVVDSTHLILIANPTTGAPKKATIGTAFKNNTGYIYYKATNAAAADVPQGSWKIFKNTATDSIFLYINDSSTVYKVILSKVE